MQVHLQQIVFHAVTAKCDHFTNLGEGQQSCIEMNEVTVTLY